MSDQYRRTSDSAYKAWVKWSSDTPLETHPAVPFVAGFNCGLKEAAAEIETLRSELLAVAQLAANTPQFYSPLHIIEAKAIRDRVLEDKP